VRIGVITFPGSLDDVDAARAVRLAGAEPVALWHDDHDLQDVDAVVLPGGFSYGDYLRAGAIATQDYEAGQRIVVPVKNGEGRYVAAPADLDRIEGEGRVAVRYVEGNPNGSMRDIAGVTSENGRVVGLMPHPEHAVEDLTGPSTDGLGFFTSVLKAVVAA
jgi:phosphoribosylformylglycinamidine synthase